MMPKPHYVLGAILVLGSLVLNGCGALCDSYCRSQYGLNGPCPDRFVPLEQLIDQYNLNAQQVPDLWTRVEEVQIRWIEADGRRGRYSLPQGNLLLAKTDEPIFSPQNFVLRGQLGTGQEVFRLGSSADSGLWYLRYDVPGAETGSMYGRVGVLYGPEGGTSNIDPVQLLSVLGVMPWPGSPGEPPYAVMTAQTAPCAFVVEFLLPRPGGGLYVQREVWLDRAADVPRPMRVRLYDVQGRMVMDATLADYRAIRTGSDPSAWPVMPTNINIDWPLVGTGVTGMRIRLRDMDTTRDLPAAAFQVPPDVLQTGRPVGPVPVGPAIQMEGPRR